LVTYITTSWDDGHPDDLALADLLAKYGVRGTFYVPRDNPYTRRMSSSEIVELSIRSGIEVGSHGLTHSLLPSLSRTAAELEIAQSREWLQQLLGKAVHAFCYPGGEYSSWMPEFVRSSGYRVGRTTRTHVFTWSRTWCKMPTGVQVYPHSGLGYLRRAIRHRNIQGLRSLLGQSGVWPIDVFQSCLKGFELCRRRSGLLHLWGHAWELSQVGAWNSLERVLKHLSEQEEVAFLTNSEAASLWEEARDCASS
jgi:peptidoglycan-N-acetylglucosamine deacetylase